MIFKNFSKIDIHSKLVRKLIILIFLFLFMFIFLVQVFNMCLVRYKFEQSVLSIAEINSKNVFSLDKIFLFSSANATNNATNNAQWDLNISQYSDIAIFINNNSNELTNENLIKELYLDEFKFNTKPAIRYSYSLL